MVNEDLITADLMEYIRRYVFWHYKSLRNRGITTSATRDDMLSAAYEGICNAALWFDRTKSDVSRFRWVAKNYVKSKLIQTATQFDEWENQEMREEGDEEEKTSEEFGDDAIVEEELSRDEEEADEVARRIRKCGNWAKWDNLKCRKYHEFMEEGLLGHTYDNFKDIFEEEMGLKKEKKDEDDDSDVHVVFTQFNDETYVAEETSEEEIEEKRKRDEQLDNMMERLTERERRVMGRLYGLPGYDLMKISDVAKMEGMSVYQVKQVADEAERKMRG